MNGIEKEFDKRCVRDMSYLKTKQFWNKRTKNISSTR